MKVKRYEGKSEAAIMPIVIQEMGEGATIISVKQKPATGFFSFFRKPTVIITAACEDDQDFLKLMNKPDTPPLTPTTQKSEAMPITAEIAAANSLEENMSLLLAEASKAANKIEAAESAKRKKAQTPEPENTTWGTANPDKKYKNSMVQLFYDTMLKQEVLPEVAAHILREVENADEKSQTDVQSLMRMVYTGIVDMLTGPTLIDTNQNASEVIIFMGPTGVGKTTTIAKLSSVLTLKHGLKVGLVTADTYRIAAVEQLRTYADILGLDIRVVYSPEEMEENISELRKKCNIVLVDTAGRSHKNAETMKDLKALLDVVPDSKRYLVVSVTTRYEDLCKIVNVYDSQSDFNLIFTKLDEADTLGALMNICCIAGKKAAYVTFGQSVPDDLEAIKPDKIAKSLLGLVEGQSHPYAEGGQP